ncbi:hypothetical protein A0H81_09384 [Grifola frondosa]|uniref:Uncharacterized protein n=1 Tax=Grifola frondosa TaxID=5627 RepID=A0A1C7M2D0_GRIFR|nr:hypothetical protein A0H81_09384 [Grifola frondosa]
MTRTQAEDPGGLMPSECYWRDSQPWLEASGYMLRPRYKPDWTPSWKDTKKPYYECEDGLESSLGHLVDAVRISDGAMVMLKKIEKSVHSHEADIASI